MFSLLLAIFVVLIPSTVEAGCCSSIIYPVFCNSKRQCCEISLMFGKCLKAQTRDLVGFFNDEGNKEPDSLYEFDRDYVYDYALNVRVSSSPHAIIDNGIRGKAIKSKADEFGLILHEYEWYSCFFESVTKGLTVSFWLKYDNKTGPSQTFFTYGDDKATPGGARLQVTQPNTTLDEIAVTVNHKGFRLSVIVPAPWNIWSHFMVSMDLVNGPSLVMYRNGKAVDDGYYNICFGCNTTHQYQAYIGEGNNKKTPNAIIDDIAVFCREIHSTEVQKIYQFYTGDTGYILIIEVNFPDQDSKNGIKAKAKTLINGVTNDDAVYTHCKTAASLECLVAVNVTNEDGNAIKPFIEHLGDTVKQYKTTVVPKTDIVMKGQSNKSDELEVEWEIPDDQDFSKFQYYNVSCSQRTPPSSVVYISNERYDLTAKFTSLQAFTVYEVTIKQYFLGGAYKSLTINVTTKEAAPGPPTEVHATSVNTTCIRLEWKNPATPIGGKIRGFLIDYVPSKTPSVGPSQVEFPTNMQQSYSKDVCGLTSETEYSFNVTAKTIDNGKSADTIKGSTLGPVPTDHPENVVSHNATPPHDDTSTCKVSWDNVTNTDIHMTSFRIAYTKVGSNKTLHVQLGVCNTSRILTDLDHYSRYKVKVAVSNLYGFGPLSPPVYCYTKGLVPAAPPTNVKAVGKTSTSCLVSWGEVPKEFQNNLILGYNVTYLKQDDPESNMKYVDVQGALSSKTEITDLAKFTNYNLTITAYTDKGMGNKSAFVHKVCQTLEDVPEGVPSGLAVTDRTNVSCSISWIDIPADLANGIIKGYEITGLDTNNTDVNTNSLGVHMTCDKSITLTSLQPFRMYNVTVAGFNTAGASNKSNVLPCITAEEAPLIPPPNLKCTGKTSRIIEVCWDEIPILLRQGIVRKYEVESELLNISSSPQLNTSPDRCHNLTNLEEYSEYSIRVRAVTVKEGNFSETPVKCMTHEGLPTSAPVNVTGNNITAYSLWISWGGLDSAPPGILRKYVVYWRVWNASEDTTVNTTISAKLKKYTLEDLELFTRYCIQVAGYTVGVGPKSNCIFISTDDKWLPPPDGIPEKVYENSDSTSRNCSIEWSKSNNSNPDPDGKVIGYTIYYRYFGTNDTWKEEEVQGENSTRHVLQDLEEYSKYEIRVAGFNLYGVGNKSIMLKCYTKEAAPSLPPVNITGVNASSTSISVNWGNIPTQDENGVIRMFCVYIYKKDLGNSSAVVVCDNNTASDANKSQRRRRAISIDPKTKVINGLDKFTTYAIQVFGVTIAAGPKSPVIYVTTAEDVTTAPVNNLTVENSSSTSLFMTWSNVPTEHRNGIIRYFVVFYWIADWPIVEMKNVTIPIDDVRITTRRRRRSVTIPSSAKFKFNMTGLNIWTNYTVQVAAFTVGVGARTNEITISTAEDVPCLPPQNIVFDIPQFGSLQVNWKKVSRHCRNGVIRGYRLIYQELSPGRTPVVVNLTTDQFSYTLEKMNMEVNYTLSVLAYTSVGDGNASYDLARPDIMGPKHTPINVTAENFTTPTTIPVFWKPIEESSILVKLLGYKVKWRVLSEGDEDIEEAPWKSETVRKDQLTFTIEGLENFNYYQIEVSGFTRGGFGPCGITFGETCRCYRRITTNYRVFSPYNSAEVSPDFKKVNMSGMIPEILNNLTTECCQTCKSHGRSYVDFVKNGQGESAFQNNEMDVISLIDDLNDLSFPIYGWKWQDQYQEIYRYIPLVQSPGFAFLLLEPQTESPLRAIIFSILGTWPYLLITCIMALVAGAIMWFMDTAYNEEHFPHTYFKGIANGWWWAFISMTTLGYGDKVPKANHSKAFSVIWVLTGLVIFGILSGSISTAFTTVIYQASTKLYGTEVGVVYNTPEYRFAVRRNARVNTVANYTSFDEILDALVRREVTGILMDTYEAGTKVEKFKQTRSKVRIHQIFDYSSTFGVVIAGPSKKLYKCSQNWMSSNRAEMSQHIAKYQGVVETNEINEMVEMATGLFNADSEVFKSFLKYSLSTLGVFVVLGSIYDIYFYMKKQRKNKLESTSPAYRYKKQLTELRKFTNKLTEELLEKLSNLKQKHKNEQALFFRINRGKLMKSRPKSKLPSDKI